MTDDAVFAAIGLVSLVISLTFTVWTRFHLRHMARLLAESAQIRTIYHCALMFYAGTEDNRQAVYALEKASAVPVDGKAGERK